MNTFLIKIFALTLPIITISSLLFSSIALGQDTDHIDEDKTKLGIGVHGGANFNYFTVTAASLTSASEQRAGALMGVHIEGMHVGVATLRLELNYSVKGYEIANLIKVNHNYLQIPVLFRFSPIIGPIELFAEIGPAAAIHLSSSAELANTTVTFNDNAKNWDFSAIAGLGVGLKYENILLEIEGRYDYGFTNLSDTYGVEVKSRAIQALAGITFLI